MDIEHQSDAAIDKTLAALKAATPPEGLETRITQRLAQIPTTHTPSRWRTLLLTTAPAPAFWRGAATGAAFALLAVAAILLLQHKTAPRDRITANTPTPPAVPLKVAGTPTVPCARPPVLRTRRVAPSPHAETLLAQNRTESHTPSHPAPALPLTAEERELLHLAHSADPKQLTALNSENQAQFLAQQAADFDKFFTPPPAAPATQIEQ